LKLLTWDLDLLQNLGVDKEDKNPNNGADLEAIDHNLISITPIHLDMTSYRDIESLKSWI